MGRPAASPLPDETYAYDPAGNLTAWPGADPTAVLHDAAGRLLTDGTHDYTWDSEGRLASKVEQATGETTGYRWDAHGRLVGIDHPDGSEISYRYDPLGRRIGRTQDGEAIWFAWDGANVAAERDSDGDLTAAHITGSAPGAVLATVAAQTTFPTLDPQGSAVAHTDVAGTLVGQQAYNAYGSPAGITGPQTYGFASYGWDAGAGLHQARARWYDPDIGRFLSEDPNPAANPYV